MESLQGKRVTFRIPIDQDRDGKIIYGPTREGIVTQDLEDGWLTVDVKLSWEERQTLRMKSGRLPEERKPFHTKREWLINLPMPSYQEEPTGI